MNDVKCVHCGSEQVEPGDIQSTGYLYFRPTNSRFMTLKTADIRVYARICPSCGSVTLVGDPVKVKALIAAAVAK